MQTEWDVGSRNSESANAFEQALRDRPDAERIDVLFCDINGILRGKWVPRDAISKICGGEIRLPVSTSALNLWGEDVDESGLGIVSGDKDGPGIPVASSVAPVPWAKVPALQVLMELRNQQGEDSDYDPRTLLRRVVERFAAKGLTPVVATELEFFLLNASNDSAAISPNAVENASHLYDLAQMERSEAVLMAINAACAAQGLPADAVIAESARGQFEINLLHQPDALVAADHAVMFKRLVQGVARAHGLEATFMAKPFGEDAGSGMHMHVSVLDADGRNIFDATDGLAPTLQNAIAGTLTTMPDLQAIFAPNYNSFRRYSKEAFTPTQVNWGMDHRAAAIRVPEVSGKGARFEHRLCGADVNPYLAIAAVLGGLLVGLDEAPNLCASIDDDPDATMGTLSHDWQSAVEQFETSARAKSIFGAEFIRVFSVVKRFEIGQFKRMVSTFEYETFLGRI
jgi:glutamine synthetase